MTKQVTGNNQKYKELKHLFKTKAGLNVKGEQDFAIDKLINFVVLLDEIEQENIKLKMQKNENK